MQDQSEDLQQKLDLRRVLQYDNKEDMLQELIRLMKSNMQVDQPQGNLANVDDFAGMNVVFARYGAEILSSWIVDMRATNHMCVTTCILDNLSPLLHPTLVHLPDSTTQSLTQTVHSMSCC